MRLSQTAASRPFDIQWSFLVRSLFLKSFHQALHIGRFLQRIFAPCDFDDLAVAKLCRKNLDLQWPLSIVAFDAIISIMDTHLPPLMPDIEFDLLPKTDDASSVIFEIKRDAMGQHIIKHWGWEEDVQVQIHKKNFETKPFFQINREDERVGVVSFLTSTDHVRFGEFYLLGPHRGSGLGTRILRHCLSVADEKGLPVRLEYLKWNPVGRLYLRHGFSVIRENDIHYFMERPTKRPRV